ncbi:MAG: PilZ domain-containing protein [Candidatus Brocadiales bacterium]|nr:PilZ domain-containing protein [Candidatus Brocadiales bacterium]
MPGESSDEIIKKVCEAHQISKRFYNIVDKEIFMTGMEKAYEHRASERMDLGLQILLYDLEGKTINISANGVYLEVITKDLETFAPGSAIPIEINTVTSTPGLEARDVRLMGKGFVVRYDIKDVTDNGNRLRVALEFKDRLDILMN